MPKHIVEGVVAANVSGTYLSGVNVWGETASFSTVSASLLSGTNISGTYITGSNVWGSTASFGVVSASLLSGTSVSATFVTGSTGSFNTFNVGGYPLPAELLIPAFGGLLYMADVASAGPTADITQSFPSGNWAVVSASGHLSATVTGVDHLVVASPSDGRIYVGVDGVFRVHSDISVEADGNVGTHIGIFITGTEHPQWSQFADLTNAKSQQMSVSALTVLVSGAYVDLRLRTDTTRDIVTHHYQFTITRISSLNIP